MSTATDMLAAYIAAETQVLQGQSVSFGGRLWTLADLAEIRRGRKDWERRVQAETRTDSGGGSIRHQLADFSQ